MLKIGNGKGVHFEMMLSDDVILKYYKTKKYMIARIL